VLDQRVGKTLIDRLLDDDARRGRASLSGREIGAVEGAFDRICKIGADSSSCAARSYAHLPRRDFRTPAPSELKLPFSECFRNTNAGSVRCLDHKGLTAGTKKIVMKPQVLAGVSLPQTRCRPVPASVGAPLQIFSLDRI
jgi:hypothetical protein